MRTEIPALHEADADFAKTGNRGVQLYISCAQIEVTGSGTVKLADLKGVNLPDKSKTGYVFNVYSGQQAKYPMPGPSVATRIEFQGSFGKQ